MPPAFSSLAYRAIPNVCNTPTCARVSDTFKSFVNLNVDPCSDFFEYTCGSWVKSNQVAKLTGGISVPSQANDRNFDEIKAFLNGTFEELYDTIKTADPSYHTQDKMEIDRNNFKIVKDYYNSCQDVASIRRIGATPLFPMLASIENDLFPLTDVIVPEYLAKTLAATRLLGFRALLDFDIFYNSERPSYDIAYISPFSSSNGIDYKNSSVLEIYRKDTIKLLNLAVGIPNTTSDYDKLVLQESQKTNLTLWSISRIENAVEEFIKIEAELATVAFVPTKDVLSTFKTWTLKELQLINPSIDWYTFFATMVSPEYATPETPVSFQREVMLKFQELLKRTTVDALKDYYLIQSIKQTIGDIQYPYSMKPNLSIRSIEPNTEVRRLYDPPTSEDSDPLDTPIRSRQTTCAKDTMDLYYDIVGRFFTLKTLGATEELQKVQDIANTIYSTWLHETLPTTSWADEETKEKIIQKIKALVMMIGIDTTEPDWRDPSSVKSYYITNSGNSESSFYEKMSSITLLKNVRQWKEIAQEKSRNAWSEDGNSISDVNAHYSQWRNSLQILVGQIQKPFYGKEYPEYLNYGNLGMTIGHELVHSLDNSGKNYNATGYMVDWFSESATKAYDKKAQCFVDQFNKFNLTGSDGEQYPLNGTTQLAENIADSGGLAIAFSGYQNLIREQGPEQLLPGFEHLTPEQMFFVSNGVYSCSLTPKNGAEELAGAVHSPLYFRHIGTFQNSAAFANAFNCPVGSPMNPTKKCSIW